MKKRQPREPSARNVNLEERDTSSSPEASVATTTKNIARERVLLSIVAVRGAALADGLGNVLDSWENSTGVQALCRGRNSTSHNELLRSESEHEVPAVEDV